jgi:hypothetical protein
LLYNLYFSCSDDEEPPTCATAVSPPSPVATDEPVEPYAAPRTTRAAIRKVPQTRALKRAKKTKEAEVSLEAHASAVSSDDVSDSFVPSFLSCNSSLTPLFYQALIQRFIALGTECAGYLKVAKASEGTIFDFQSLFAFCTVSFITYLIPCRLLMQLL